MTTHLARSVLGFELERFEHGTRNSVVPIVDGRSLIDIVFEQQEQQAGDRGASPYIGLVPGNIRLGDLARYYLGQTLASPGIVIPLVCECGEFACNPLHMRVTVEPDTVTWSHFIKRGGRHRPDVHFTEVGPFVFDRSQYVEAVRGMTAALEAAEPGVLEWSRSRRVVPSKGEPGEGRRSD